jgi:hypothetical protein
MIEKVEYRGWPNNLRISNGQASLIVTLDVGPRLISYSAGDGFNVLKNYDEQMGGANEAEWQIRGGLRFWLAPEDLTRTYYADNAPVKHEQVGPRAVRLVPPPEKEYGVQKEWTVKLDEAGTSVRITLKATNIGPLVTDLAPWAPTVLAPGGMEIIPQPPHRNHPLHPKNARSPADFAPTQQLIFWPYFDFTDSRWTFGSRYIFLRQDAKKGPTKIGLAHRQGWVAYLNRGNLFVKRIDYLEGANYPDMGTSYQTFSNEDMLEMETVGPLVRLNPGQSAELSESWELFTGLPAVKNEDDVDKHILPLVERA